MTSTRPPTVRLPGLVGWSALLVGLTLSSAGTAQTEPAKPSEPGADARDVDLVRAVLEAHNKARAEEKLPPLETDPKLAAAARAHSEDMATHDKMTHEGSDGSTASQRIERQGYRYRSAGENVAFGQSSTDEVMKTWMNSPRHRENILGKFTQVGIAVARGKDGTPFWTVDFGTPWPVLDPSKAVGGVVEALNRERAAAKKRPLKAVVALNRVAAGTARSFARADALDPGPDRGEELLKEIRSSGYRYRKLAELAASGQPEPPDVVASLLKDPANRDTLLGDFTDVGIGYATTTKGVPYWNLILARPAR
jgi:uncharacterized protein YkwD